MCPAETSLRNAIEQLNAGNFAGAKIYTKLGLDAIDAIIAHPKIPEKPKAPEPKPVIVETPKNYMAWVWGAIILMAIGGSVLLGDGSGKAQQDDGVPHVHR